MDRIEKSLQKLTPKERGRIKEIVRKLEVDDTAGLDIQKLKGKNDIFRIRKGNIRIVYRKDSQGKIFLLAIERRKENMYRGL